jgi:hypothetical protein
LATPVKSRDDFNELASSISIIFNPIFTESLSKAELNPQSGVIFLGLRHP